MFLLKRLLQVTIPLQVTTYDNQSLKRDNFYDVFNRINAYVRLGSTR